MNKKKILLLSTIVLLIIPSVACSFEKKDALTSNTTSEDTSSPEVHTNEKEVPKLKIGDLKDDFILDFLKHSNEKVTDFYRNYLELIGDGRMEGDFFLNKVLYPFTDKESVDNFFLDYYTLDGSNYLRNYTYQDGEFFVLTPYTLDYIVSADRYLKVLDKKVLSDNKILISTFNESTDSDYDGYEFSISQTAFFLDEDGKLKIDKLERPDQTSPDYKNFAHSEFTSDAIFEKLKFSIPNISAKNFNNMVDEFISLLESASRNYNELIVELKTLQSESSANLFASPDNAEIHYNSISELFYEVSEETKRH